MVQTSSRGPATGGSKADPLAADGFGVDVARSAVEPLEPHVEGGWLVSARSTEAVLRLVDCSPTVKILVQAPPAGLLARHLAVQPGRAELFEDGFLVACTAPGEWQLLCPEEPGEFLDRFAEIAPGEPVSVADLTHGRTVLRISGAAAADVLAPLTALDLSERALPLGAATAAAVAGVRTTIVRDDLFADEAGLAPTPADADADADAPMVPSYILICDRSVGRYLHERLLQVGRARGLAEEGYPHYRARRADV